MISNIFPIVFTKGCTQTPSKSEALVFVEKNDLAGKTSPKIGKYFFRIFHLHVTQKKLLDTLRVPLSRTREF